MEKFVYWLFLISTVAWPEVTSAPCLMDRFESPVAPVPRRISRTSNLSRIPNETTDSSTTVELVTNPTAELSTSNSGNSPILGDEANPNTDVSTINNPVTYEEVSTMNNPTTDEEVSTNPVESEDVASSNTNASPNRPREEIEPNPTIELLTTLATELSPTTTESPIKKAAKALAQSFHEMSRRMNQTFASATARTGRSGILRLPSGSNEVSDYMGIRIPPPLDFSNLRKAMKAIPTLPPVPNPFKPTPPMHAIGISGLLTDGNLRDLANGR